MNMLSKVMLGTGAFVLAAFIWTNGYATTLPEAAEATFKLYDGDTGICSVSFIGNDDKGAIFLTAAHCVDDKTAKLNIRTQKLNLDENAKDDKYKVISEEVHYLKVLRQTKDDDTALLQVTDKDYAPAIAAVEIATPEEANKISFGQDLIVLGFPAAEQKSITKGSFTGKRAGVLDVKEQYQTTVPVAGGNSGGGLYTLFGDEYKLIGTTSAKRNDNEIMTYFSTAEAVKRITAGFLNKGGNAPVKLDQLPNGKIDSK